MQCPVISIIDDDPSVREGTIDVLNSAGFFAEAFKDADEFLKSDHLDGISCLVADIRMPGLSGLELHNHLLRSGRNIPTILMTAFPRDIDRDRALSSGVCCYLAKPINEKDLLSYVRLALSSQSGANEKSREFTRHAEPAGSQNKEIVGSTVAALGGQHSLSRPYPLHDRPLSEKVAAADVGTMISLFHERWWLSAVTEGRFQESIVEQGGNIVGRLPYVIVHRGPFRTIRMPPFTHLLGPVINAGAGKPQTRLLRRLSITRTLIDQLPPNSFFLQHLDQSMDGGLAIADGLAFQDRGFSTSPQYTFEIDCRKSTKELWNAMHFKTRQHIRRAEEKYTIHTVDDPKTFINFYLRNIKASGKVNEMDFGCFPSLFTECISRRCGEILSAVGPDGSPLAMVYLVWGHGTMYYLMSTRAPDKSDNGSVNFLIWSAMKRASQLGVIFDLDGVYSSGTARFLAGFGGQIKTRLTIRRGRLVYRALQFVKGQYTRNETQFFT